MEYKKYFPERGIKTNLSIKRPTPKITAKQTIALFVLKLIKSQ
jgi:hypothetical protein